MGALGSTFMACCSLLQGVISFRGLCFLVSESWLSAPGLLYCWCEHMSRVCIAVLAWQSLLASWHQPRLSSSQLLPGTVPVLQLYCLGQLVVDMA